MSRNPRVECDRQVLYLAANFNTALITYIVVASPAFQNSNETYYAKLFPGDDPLLGHTTDPPGFKDIV